MADLRERKNENTEKENENTNVKTSNTETNTQQTNTNATSYSTNPNFNQTIGDNSLENWNAYSYWYNAQSYYQQCYMNAYYYWHFMASQGYQYDPSLVTQVDEGLTQRQARNVQVQPIRFEACDARVSSIQKRVFAELIDFFFLYFTKFLMFAIFYNSIDKYTQLQYSLIIDENTNLKDLEEILIQALVYRFMVFGYETFFLVGGFYGELGGSTPGKHIVGLSVLAVDRVDTIENNVIDGEKVRISPAENPGWWRAGVRALVKNFSMTFLFPVFLTIFFFNNNRTIYDIIAGTIVVDKKSIKTQQQQQ